MSRSFGFDLSLLTISFSYLILVTTHGAFTPLVTIVIQKYGIKTSFIISQVLLSFFLAFASITNNLFHYFIGFFIWGVAAAFWWVSYHYYFLEVGLKNKFGQEMSYLEILAILISLIAPLFAGLIITFLGQVYLFGAATIIILSSVTFLLMIKDFEKNAYVRVADILQESLSRKRDLLAFIGAGGEEIVYSVVWPLLLFIVFNDFIKLGIFSSVILLIAVVVTWLVGKLCDTTPKEKLEKVGSLVIGSTWLGKFLMQHPAAIFVLDSIYRIFYHLFSIPLTTLAYSHALHDNKIRYVVFRELSYKLGNMLGLLLFILLIVLKMPFWSIFFFAAIFSVLPMIAKER